MVRSCVVVACMLLLGTPGTIAAQRIRGSVADSAGRPVTGVTLRALTTGGRELATTTSDTAGFFTLTLPDSGTYQLAASRLGYATVAPSQLRIARGEEVQVRIRADVEAMRLSAIEVSTRPRAPVGREAVYQRIARMRDQGVGHAVTREDIERMRSQTTARLLAAAFPGVRAIETRDVNVNNVVYGTRARCAPAIFIDGMRANTRPFNINFLIDPNRIEAVEMYIGGAQIPVGFHDPNGCGSILIWSRSDMGPTDPGKPHSLKRFLVAGGLIAAAVLLLRYW